MPKNEKRPTESQEAQSERFIATARELGADESMEAFNEKLKKVAGAKVAQPQDDALSLSPPGTKSKS